MEISAKAVQLCVLLVDDDAELCAMLKEYVTQKGFELDCAYNGRDGLVCARRKVYDVVLLDVMLPTIDGFSVLQQLRRSKDVPIIMLTARAHRDDRIMGLTKGADDYLTKPFDPDELLARIHAVLRRGKISDTQAPAVRTFKNIQIDFERREVLIAQKPVALTSLEFDILEMLVRSAGRVVSREEISQTLLNRTTSPYDRALDVHVSHLRTKLEGGLVLIRTIRGVGYVFTSELDCKS